MWFKEEVVLIVLFKIHLVLFNFMPKSEEHWQWFQKRSKRIASFFSRQTSSEFPASQTILSSHN